MISQEEFLRLIDQHQDIIHKICRLYRDRKEDREDLFQEIVFQLWKSVNGFDGRSKFSTWMYKVALSTAVAVYRKRKIPIFFMDELPDQPETSPINTDRSDLLFEALKTLDDGDKALIILYLEDLSYKEIADISGISENYVGVKLNRIKSKIQQIIKTE
jgi:RNA polymerase sigma factor (sigma-70 family)